MGFFDGIEKLITEHGSAAILKERLLLIADKYAALEKTLVVCEAKAKEIISEKQAFQLENLKLKEKVRGLEEQLTERHGARLEQVKERILQLLANSPPRITAQQVAAALNIDAQISMYHLTEMEKNRLINDSHRMGGSTPGVEHRSRRSRLSHTPWLARLTRRYSGLATLAAELCVGH